MSIIAVLGPMIFTPRSASIDTLTREASFTWAAQEPLGGAPVKQYTGKGDEVFSIEGEAHLELAPAAGLNLTALEAFAGTGKPVPFILGARIFGLWCITRVMRNGKHFNRNASPGVLSFTVEISRYNARGGNLWPF